MRVPGRKTITNVGTLIWVNISASTNSHVSLKRLVPMESVLIYADSQRI